MSDTRNVMFVGLIIVGHTLINKKRYFTRVISNSKKWKEATKNMDGRRLLVNLRSAFRSLSSPWSFWLRRRTADRGPNAAMHGTILEIEKLFYKY